MQAFGHLVYRSEINSRKWHAEYKNVLVLVERMRFSDSESVDIVALRADPQTFTYSAFASRSPWMTVIATAFINLTIAWLVGREFEDLAYMGGALGVAAQLVFVAMGSARLKKAQCDFLKNPHKNFCLAGLDPMRAVCRKSSDEGGAERV